MKHLYVKSLPLRDVLKDLATELHGQVEKHCEEYLLNIPTEHGKGYVRGINFAKGLGLIEYNCTFNEDLCIHFSLSEVHPLKFIFCSSGSLKHTFEEIDKPNLIETYQNTLVASSSFNGHILHFEAHKTCHINSLEIDRKKFIENYHCSIHKFDHPLKPLLSDVEAHKVFCYQGNYSLKTSDIITEMNTDTSSDFLRIVKLESKALEMLSVQIEQYEDDLKLSNNQTLIRRHEIEKIVDLLNQINADLSVAYTVKEMAESIGINVNKLQEGFKYLYNETVNTYIQRLRLKKAEELLLNTDWDIQEITEKIGLNNPSYFSKLFKERYHITPNQFRKGNTPKESFSDL